ncbi:MAG: hypothetical protein R3C11_04940 [Planctomycetaceae bacterium]
MELITTTLNGSLCGRIHNLGRSCRQPSLLRCDESPRYYDQAVTALIEDIYNRS